MTSDFPGSAQFPLPITTQSSCLQTYSRNVCYQVHQTTGIKKVLVGLSTECGKSMDSPSTYSLLPDAPCRLVSAAHLASTLNASTDPTRYSPLLANLTAVPRLAFTGPSKATCLAPMGVQNHIQAPKESRVTLPQPCRPGCSTVR